MTRQVAQPGGDSPCQPTPPGFGNLAVRVAEPRALELLECSSVKLNRHVGVIATARYTAITPLSTGNLIGFNWRVLRFSRPILICSLFIYLSIYLFISVSVWVFFFFYLKEIETGR